ncbi:hypothetical protein V9T40_011068 [Parthenolecanium corni]|uniref:C2H2-type domain-containing protein n=1 Tax=Parthenolecanium corni TaxID=536013 RepID=A0AAN9THZ0_9HEMI
MKANSLHFQLIGLILLTLVPWPGPTVFKIKCPRDSAAVVRRLIQNKWIPVLEKYQVKLPLECPFHPMRDIFYPQEAAKRQFRPSQWTCGFCGKSFYLEKYLDLHFDNRHRNKINMAEDAVCLADYCDIMRCEVLQAQYEKQNNAGNGYFQLKGKSIPITDLEVWREPSQRTALSVITGSKKSSSTAYEKNTQNNLNLCDKSEAPQGKGDHESENRTTSRCETLVDSVLPPRQRFVELQKLKANCKAEDLLKLKVKCEDLVRDCIAGLLVNLSVQDFKDIEGELNNAVCWYLTCDRYWEDTQSNPRNVSWGLIFIPVAILSLALTLCYYIIWIFFDSNDLKPADETTLHNYPSYRYVKQYSDEYYPASDENPSSNEHYIYVTYPPEIKRKLLDSCYNRTTRL